MKKTIETQNNNIKVIVNTKGGAGKSTLSKIIATLSVGKYENINIYEIDDNNSKGDLSSTIVNHRLFKINDKSEAVFDASFEANNVNTINIIDAGGGNDSIGVIETLAKNKIENLEFFIPTMNDGETIDNIIQTSSKIKKYFPDAIITLVLMRVPTLDTYKDKFISIFGYKKYGKKGRLDEIEQYITKIALVPDGENLIMMIKDDYKIEMADLYLSAKDVNDNKEKYRQEWLAKGDKEFYFKQMEIAEFGMDLERFVDDCSQTIKL